MQHHGPDRRAPKLELEAVLEYTDGSLSKAVVLKCSEVCNRGLYIGNIEIESGKIGKSKVSAQ